MMLQNVFKGACRSASVLLRTTPSATQVAAQRSLMMMAGGDIPAPQSGTVKSFDTKRGFGFIAPTSGGPDIFVHQTEIKREGFRFLEKGETVEFRVEEGETGRQRAFNVTGPNGEELPPSKTQQPRGGPRPSSPGRPPRRGPPRRYEDREGRGNN